MAAKNILLVEDEEHLLKIIQLNLELEGYAVTTAVTGIEALKEFRKKPFDTVLLDVMLPEMNGFDVLEEMRKEDKHVPVLFLTAKGAGEDRVANMVRMNGHYDHYGFLGNPNVLTWLLGRPPTRFDAYLQRLIARG